MFRDPCTAAAALAHHTAGIGGKLATHTVILVPLFCVVRMRSRSWSTISTVFDSCANPCRAWASSRAGGGAASGMADDELIDATVAVDAAARSAEGEGGILSAVLALYLYWPKPTQIHHRRPSAKIHTPMIM
jgi:hypothetical protein